jgi:hypothetical protein
MATGRSMYLTRQAGEYLVCAELCRRGLIATTFAGNLPGFDIVAVGEGSRITTIQVKTISGPGGSWQFDARNFLEISISNGVQTVKGKTKPANPDLVYVLVRLTGQAKDEFYICPSRGLQDLIYRDYKAWLAEKGGRRPRNPKSTHTAVSPDDLKGYRNKWDIIRRPAG